MNWYFKVLRDFSNFKGRARRKEFWVFLMINSIMAILMTVLDELLGTKNPIIYGYFSCIYGLIALVPSIAVMVRRLHDIGKSGWWTLIILIPIIGNTILLVFASFEGEPDDNKWGPDPKDYY